MALPPGCCLWTCNLMLIVSLSTGGEEIDGLQANAFTCNTLGLENFSFWYIL